MKLDVVQSGSLLLFLGRSGDMLWPVVWLGDQGLGRNMIGKLGAKKLGEEIYGSITRRAKDCEGICVLCESNFSRTFAYKISRHGLLKNVHDFRPISHRLRVP